MAPHRVLLCPQFTEVEWAIAPQLSEWAEVATFDAPGVGDEPLAVDDPELIDRDLVVRRALQELERLAWDSYVVVGDAWGTATAARVAASNPGPVLGVALGHASLDYTTDGARPAVNSEVVAAMTQLLRTDYDSFVRFGLTQFTQGGFDEEMSARIVERFPAAGVAARVWEMLVERPEPIGELLRSLGKPMLLAGHEGCLVFTAEGYEDLVAAFPEADSVRIQTASAASDEFADALRRFCDRVGG
ncbi:MAG TPA: alpha/beta fold hydrolase [Solirubrobacterales bacterium]|nr:alpha/beta fold hydrolase [Solirubrobacterales bacterium]